MKVLKAKFNSYRRPEYRMATLVVEDGLSAHVVKRALDERALPHLQGLAEKCQRTQETYPRIKVL
ncbi:MAG TPA: hypothetical protein VNI20_00940, partial [Fimbriimonadaceae bacterium]|nr:hypothetical protein [Fimbriimonadaceae bacterium]